MDTLFGEHEKAMQRRGWGALLLFTLGLALVAVVITGPAGMTAASEVPRRLDELGPASPLAAGIEWMRVTTNLSGAYDLLSVYPDVAVSSDGQYVAVVWQEQEPGDGEEQGWIYIRCAREGTPWWGARSAVPGSYERDAEGHQRRGQTPAVALYGNQVHVVWSGGYDGDYDKIYYRSGTISDSNLVDWDSGSLQTVADVGYRLVVPDIAVDDNGQPHVVWERDNADNTRDIFYGTMPDGGVVWTSHKVSRDDDTQNQDPAVAAGGTTAHAAWVGGTISGTVSIEAGNVYYANSSSWEAIKISSYGWEPKNPSIATMGGRVGVVWEAWKDNSPQKDVGPEDQWFVLYNSTADSTSWPERVSLDHDGAFYPHLQGDEYVRSVRPSLIYANNPMTPTEPIPHVALARTFYGWDGTMSTFWYMQDDGDWGWEIIPLGGSTSGERGAARMVIGRFGSEDHVHFVYQAVVGMDSQGQNRWDVFYTSDAVYSTDYFPTIYHNHP